MIKSFDGKTPQIAPSAYVSPLALVIGDVEIGEGSCVWPFAIIRGDLGKIRIGRECYIEDQALLHGFVQVSDYTVIGHGAIVEGEKVGSHVLIGSNANMLGLSEIGDNCIIAANALVPKRSRIPPYSMVTGVPGIIKRTLTPQQHRAIMDEVLAVTVPLAQKYREQGL